jgi:uncharacterized membrane protein YqjE
VSAGLLHSAQSLLAGLLALGRTRLELFSTELQEEIARQAAALLGAFVVLVLAGLGAAFGAVALIVAVGDDYRLVASIGVAVLFLALAVAAAWSLRHLARAKPRPFQASIVQLERDYDVLKP